MDNAAIKTLITEFGTLGYKVQSYNLGAASVAKSDGTTSTKQVANFTVVKDSATLTGNEEANAIIAGLSTAGYDTISLGRGSVQVYDSAKSTYSQTDSITVQIAATATA